MKIKVGFRESAWASKGFSLSIGILIILTLITSLIAAVPGRGDEPGQQQEKPGPSWRQEMIKLKFTTAEDIRWLLYSYLSPTGRIFTAKNLPDVLTIADFSENVEKALAAIKQIDVKPADFLFTVQVILASEDESKVDPELQADPMIRELRQLLRYQGFILMDTAVIRGVDQQLSSIILGDAAQFSLQVKGKVARGQTPEIIQTEVLLFQIREKKATEGSVISPNMPEVSPKIIWVSVNKNLLQSHLNIKSGERSVVGVSRLDGGEKGLILIISGKILE